MSNITLNSGSGGATLGTDTVAGAPNVDYQIVKLGYSASGIAPTQVDATHGLPVNVVAGTVGATQSGAWNITDISGTVSLPTGAATAAKQPALGTAGAASTDVITVQGIASMTALKVDGSAVTQPVSGTFWQATQPVSIAATVNTSAAQSGTWTVQPGNTANTTPWLATNVPGTSPGSTPSRIKSAASTNGTNLKASAGVLLGYALYNNTSTPKFFKFYNKATGPTVGTDTPLFTVIVPAGGGANLNWADGVPFSTGIAYAITGAVTDTDATATAADDVHGVVLWK